MVMLALLVALGVLGMFLTLFLSFLFCTCFGHIILSQTTALFLILRVSSGIVLLIRYDGLQFFHKYLKHSHLFSSQRD